jgi:ATP-dependent DNA ligase
MSYELTKWITENRTKATTWKGEGVRWIERKHDGVRMALVKERDGTMRAIQRKNYHNYLSRLPKWLQCIVDDLPNGTIIDGELCCPGNATEVTHFLNFDPEQLTYHAFAMPWNSGVNITDANLITVRDVLQDRGFSVPLLSGYHSSTEDQLHHRARESNYEGFMLKADHWFAWFKCKPVKTVDCIVLGWYPGEPGTQYETGLGGFRVGVYRGKRLVELARCGGGFTKEQRLNPEFREAMLDEVIEVAYDKVDNKGGLRFPRFKRIRHDKPMEECTDVQLS